jgi:hypothetical protein
MMCADMTLQELRPKSARNYLHHLGSMHGEIPPCHPILAFQILGDAETVVAVIALEKLSCSVGV